MANQGDIRAFESEQERRSAAPPPAALSAPALAPAPRAAIPLGVQLPKIVTTSEAMDKAVTGMLGQQQALNERLGPMQQQVEQRRSALSGELDQPLPGAPKMQDIPQFQPRQVSNEELTLFAGVAMALAGLGTKAMRGDLTMALNAAGNAMKGFNEGNLQQSRLDLENFKRQMDAVIAQNHKMSEEYRAILENRKLSLQQKDQLLRVAAAARDDQIMLSALQSGQLKTVFDLEAHRINAANQAAIQSANMYNTAIWHQTQAEQRMEIAQLQAQREPLVPVQEPDGRTVYRPRSQAEGAIVPPRQTGDKLTETEAKGTLFWRQMSSAEEAAKQIAGPAFDTSQIGSQIGVRMAQSDWTNWLAPENAQKYAQAAEQWAEAYLRLKTGAATTQDEIRRNARAYFPQPGDEAGTIKQKNDMRAKAIQDVSIIAQRGIDKAPAGGTPPAGKSFATEAEAAAAASAGRIRAGDRITVGGKPGTWR